MDASFCKSLKYSLMWCIIERPSNCLLVNCYVILALFDFSVTQSVLFASDAVTLGFFAGLTGIVAVVWILEILMSKAIFCT